MEAADVIEFLRTLRTVRRFTDQPVPQVVLDDLLTVARWSGSANNRQPWVFVVIRDRATLQRLAALEGYVSHLAGAALAIVLVMDGHPDQVAQETFDEGVLSQRLQLAAAAHGLGSAIGWFHGAGRQMAKEILGIPRERLVRTALSVGYEDAGAEDARFHPPRARASRSPRSSGTSDSTECELLHGPLRPIGLLIATRRPAVAAASPSRRRAESRFGYRDRGRPRCGTQQPGTPLPLLWTAVSVEPRVAA